MRVKEVTVIKSFTRNLGKFESTRAEYGLTVTVDEGESVDEVERKVSAKVEKWVTNAINEIDNG